MYTMQKDYKEGLKIVTRGPELKSGTQAQAPDQSTLSGKALDAAQGSTN